GIGLTLVRGIVELHGGTVEARSDGPGKGSEFVVRLPLTAGVLVPRAPRRRDEGAGPAGKLRVLVVDDNIDGVESLSLLLRLLGMDVRTALDGPSALEALREWRPTVMLLDIGMPGMD